MKRTRGWVLVASLLLAWAGGVRAQSVQDRILPGAVGGFAGVVGGGYVALSVVVAEARAGTYLHDFNELFGWRGLPVIAGGALGVGLGVYSPERLKQAILYGFGGMAIGGGVGAGLGQLIWTGPEGKWAGLAIGAGAGLVAGYLTGAITASSEDDIGGGGGGSARSGLPLMIRIPVR